MKTDRPSSEELDGQGTRDSFGVTASLPGFLAGMQASFWIDAAEKALDCVTASLSDIVCLEDMARLAGQPETTTYYRNLYRNEWPMFRGGRPSRIVYTESVRVSRHGDGIQYEYCRRRHGRLGRYMPTGNPWLRVQISWNDLVERVQKLLGGEL